MAGHCRRPDQGRSLLHCQGLSELVRDTAASFYEGLEKDNIQVLDLARAAVVADDSHYYRRSRLWLEAALRKTAVPLDGIAVTVSAGMLADPLGYQRTAVRAAFDPANLRTRILLADAVGLGKTLEIGMILAELIRRGRGERILIVTPRHVLEQMQHEMWSRFAIPFVRLDSQGIQRVRQKLPATRNPFSYYKRVIISIDTLKSDRYLAYVQSHGWDAVVIDESHNLTNTATQNNRLARALAAKTDALILIDRYGQRHPPQITTLLLDPDTEAFPGDLRVLSRLIAKEHEAHTALGDVASLMGKYDVGQEEEEIRRVLAGQAALDEVVRQVGGRRPGRFHRGPARPHHGRGGRVRRQDREGRGARPAPVPLPGRSHLPARGAYRGLPDPWRSGAGRRPGLARARRAEHRRVHPAPRPAPAS